jgi:hypothetical protein
MDRNPLILLELGLIDQGTEGGDETATEARGAQKIDRIRSNC